MGKGTGRLVVEGDACWQHRIFVQQQADPGRQSSSSQQQSIWSLLCRYIESRWRDNLKQRDIPPGLKVAMNGPFNPKELRAKLECNTATTKINWFHGPRSLSLPLTILSPFGPASYVTIKVTKILKSGWSTTTHDMGQYFSPNLLFILPSCIHGYSSRLTRGITMLKQ